MTKCIFKLCGVKDRKIPRKFMWTDRHTDKSLILKKKDMFSYIWTDSSTGKLPAVYRK